MNGFLEQSLQLAQQRNYLDLLYHVYPTINNNIRDIDQRKWQAVETAYEKKDYAGLVSSLLKMELFPLKDSYVAFLKKDAGAIDRNPDTVRRLASTILSMNLNEVYEKCSQPKESNRQQGQAFKNFLRTEEMGLPKMDLREFSNTNANAILIAGDQEMKGFAESRLSYRHHKGLDFVGRMHGRYIIGEAKFLSADGGNQNDQFEDAMAVLDAPAAAIRIAVLDGVLYLPSRSKMYKNITGVHSESNIMSALLLKDFLYTIR